MFALLAAALLAADAPPASDDAATRQAYQQAKAQAGRSPDDQVRLAYWCEAHGLAAERLRHLAQAVLANPNHSAARGLLGLVARQDRWMRPEAVADQVQADAALAATLAEYDAKRSATPYTADGQMSLANWAEERGLKEQAKAHYTAVVRLDPKRESAWKKLGYKKHDGRWSTDDEIATAKADAEAQKAADKIWKPLLEKWKGQLGKPIHRAEAETNLLAVTDPRAVPSISKVFGIHEADGPRFVQLLGQIDAPTATRALAYLAVFSPSADTRRLATETLRRRDPREYAHLLIPLIHKPIRYEVKPVNGPGSPGALFVMGDKSNVKRLYEPRSLLLPTDRIAIDRFGQPIFERVLSSSSNDPRIDGHGNINHGIIRGLAVSDSDFYSQGLTAVGEGAHNGHLSSDPTLQADWSRLIGAATSNPGSANTAIAEIAANLQKTKEHPARQLMPLGLGGGFISSNGSSFSGSSIAMETTAQFTPEQVQVQAMRSAQASQQQLSNDVAQVEAQNRSINESNDRVVGVLNEATGASLPADPSAWQGWWVNLLGYALAAGQTDQNPTFVEVIPSDYQPELIPSNIIQHTLVANIADCFGAGTLVQTMTGPRSIEHLKVGDMVLTQNTTTGALGYQPITVAHHNPPATTFRVDLRGDTIVVSQFHRFWVARKGWVMARDLKVGDPVRTLGGVRLVDSVESGKVELVYNLDVAGDADFFAGTSAALVHDNTLPDPRLVPFDLPDAKAVAAR